MNAIKYFETHIWTRVAAVALIAGALAWNAVGALDQLGAPVGAASNHGARVETDYSTSQGDIQWVKMPPPYPGANPVWCVVSGEAGYSGRGGGVTCDWNATSQTPDGLP